MRSDWSELDQAIWRMNRWAVLFALAMVTAVAAAMFGLVGDTGSFVLILLALGLLVPLSNAVGRKKELEGAANPVVLSLGTVWGFLETFRLAPRVWAWWVTPAWAIGVALGQLWLRVRRI